MINLAANSTAAITTAIAMQKLFFYGYLLFGAEISYHNGFCVKYGGGWKIDKQSNRLNSIGCRLNFLQDNPRRSNKMCRLGMHLVAILRIARSVSIKDLNA